MSHLIELQAKLASCDLRDTSILVPRDALQAVVTELARKKQLELEDLFPATSNEAFSGMTIEQALNFLESLANWLEARRSMMFHRGEWTNDLDLMQSYVTGLRKIRDRLK
jgi:hypothetical protein